MTTDNDTTKSQLSCSYHDALMAGTSKSTRRAYQRDLNYFWSWASLSIGITPAYPVTLETAIQFILEHTGRMQPCVENQLIENKLRSKRGSLSVKTVRRYLSSLSVIHTENGTESPTNHPQVKLLLRRIQRSRASLPSLRKDAITSDLLLALASTCDDTLRGVRDRAIMLVGFSSGGRRRSEIANLRIEDLKTVSGGYTICIRASKTDQMGNGKDVPILGKAAQALSEWLRQSGLQEGRLFRGILANDNLNNEISGRTINRVIKHHATLAGLDSSRLGAHSLRSGFITESGRRGATLGDAMALSGHRDIGVAQQYYRQGEILSNPTANLI